MTKELSMTEKYTLLMLYGGGNRTDFMTCQFTAGIVLGGIFDLLQAGQITIARGNKLSAVQKTGAVNESYYCFSATYKSIRPVVDDVLNTLAQKGYISMTWRRGLFKKKRSIIINKAQSTPIIDEFVSEVQSGNNNDEIIFCVEMLLLADVFKSYFPMGKRWDIKSTLSAYKQSEMWKMMEPYADAVRNFNYQNTVYTGASQ